MWRKFFRSFPQGQNCTVGAYKALNIKYKTIIFSSLSRERTLGAKMWNSNCAYWAKLSLTLDGPHKYPTLAACYFAPRDSQADHNARYSSTGCETLYHLIITASLFIYLLSLLFPLTRRILCKHICMRGNVIVLFISLQ